METLNEKPSFAQMKRVGSAALADYQKLVSGLDQFGRRPGERWHALADDFIGRVLELESLLKGFKGKAYLLAREKRELTPKLAQALSSLEAQWPRLIAELIAACPVDEIPLPADPLTRTAFEKYDALAAEIALPWFERRAVQRLFRRADQPTAVPLLLLGLPGRADAIKIFELVPFLQILLAQTPLQQEGGKTLKESQAEWRRQALSRGREPAAGLRVFDSFVERVGSADPEQRKAARKELAKLRDQSVDERWGRLPENNWRASRDLLAYWDGVRLALKHPDPVYRRAALCALPGLQFSFVFEDFPEECIAFILEGLQDTDGMVRHKVAMFGKDFFNITRLSRPAVADTLERQVRDLYPAVRKTNPAARSKIRGLIKEIEWFRNYDREAGFSRAKIRLGDIVEGIEIGSPEMTVYLDLRTGEILPVSEWSDTEESLEEVGPEESLRRLPYPSSSEGYEWMAAFAQTVTDPVLSGKIVAALNGRGAFGRFRDVLAEYPAERERWFAFKLEKLRELARQWAEDEGILLTDDQPEPVGYV